LHSPCRGFIRPLKAGCALVNINPISVLYIFCIGNHTYPRQVHTTGRIQNHLNSIIIWVTPQCSSFHMLQSFHLRKNLALSMKARAHHS
jgi:hypothetical protein